MLLEHAERLAQLLMRDHGLLAKGWTFSFDSARRRFGLCSYSRRRITMSKCLVKLNSIDEVRDTILHEIAHALAGNTAGHGEAWKAECRRIGARPERCYSSDSVATVYYKWTGTCPTCGSEYVRLRNPKSYGRFFVHCKACVAANKLQMEAGSSPYTEHTLIRNWRREEIVRQPRALANNPQSVKVTQSVPAPVLAIAAARPPVSAPAASPAPASRQFSAAEAVRLYAGGAGMKVADIAVALGYPRGSGNNRVRNALIAAGVYRKA